MNAEAIGLRRSAWLRWRHSPQFVWIWVVVGLPVATLILALALSLVQMTWSYLTVGYLPRDIADNLLAFALFVAGVAGLSQKYTYIALALFEAVMLWRFGRVSLLALLLFSPVAAVITTLGMANASIFDEVPKTFSDVMTFENFMISWIWTICASFCMWLPLRGVVLQFRGAERKSVMT